MPAAARRAPLHRFAPRWRATAAEKAATLPGDELIPHPYGPSTMATTLPAPPSAVWPWLLQLGADRAGFYSWDRLDNGGRPSADRVHPEWQTLAVGDRVAAVPDGSTWFSVVRLEPERTLALRATIDLRGRPLLSTRPSRAFSDGIWSFHLTPADDGSATRLVVRSSGTGRPRALLWLGNTLFWRAAHCIMQAKQFHELRRRCDAGRRDR